MAQKKATRPIQGPKARPNTSPPKGSSAAPPWRIEHLRASIFFAPDGAHAPSKFKDIFQKDPVQTNVNHSIGQTVEAGPVEGNPVVYATISRQSGRGDFVISALPSNAQELGVPPLPFADAKEAFDHLLTLSAGWLKSVGDLKRLAIGASFGRLVSDEAEAVEAVFESANLSPRSSDTRELTLQWNRPIPSKSIDKLVINRVLRWEVGKIARISVAGSGQMTEVIGRPFAGFSIDINSAPETGIVLRDKIDNLINEMCSLGCKYFTEGDRP